MDRKKLVFKRETVKALTSGELRRARGAATTHGESGSCTAGNSGCSTVTDSCGEGTFDFSCDLSKMVACNTQGGRCW